MDFINYIKPELLIVSVILYVVGIFLKKSRLKDNYIPIILTSLGMVSGAVYLGILEGFTFTVIATGIVQGALCAGASTNVNQIIKQMKKLNVKHTDIIEDVVEALDTKS